MFLRRIPWPVSYLRCRKHATWHERCSDTHLSRSRDCITKYGHCDVETISHLLKDKKCDDQRVIGLHATSFPLSLLARSRSLLYSQLVPANRFTTTTLLNFCEVGIAVTNNGVGYRVASPIGNEIGTGGNGPHTGGVIEE